MTVEVIVLALASTIRPTSLAAVYALLSGDEPRRLMIVYVVAGLAFTIAFGLLVIWVFSGINVSAGSGHTKAIAEIAGGVIALGFAAAVASGRIGGRPAGDAPKPSRRWDKLLQHRLTLRTATIAGPMTHIPGVFYLIALNIIVAHVPKVPRGLLEVLIYNAIWFALPITALAVSIVRPAAARDAIGAIQHWTKDHTPVILMIVSLAIGAGLIVRGLLTYQ
jgi:hypothetical protein